MDAPIVTALVCEVAPIQSAARAWQPVPMPSGAPQALARIRAAAERHGGVARELPGNPGTVATVFGPEPPDGDGPLRALRAAAEIRTAFAEDGASGSRDLSVRAGVGTSEVLGEDPGAEHIWEERVVDLAVRLQRMAEPGEIIVSEGVYRRVDGAAELRPVDPRAEVDGDAPVGPLRLLEVTPGPTDLGLADAIFVGRDRELSLLREAFDRVVAARSCSLVRLTGGAGLGKTRLAEELLGNLEAEEAAAAIRVRCRPPGEGGITWPLAELVARAIRLTGADGPEQARAKVERLLPGDPDVARVAERLLPALGLPGRPAAGETPWALRRLLEGAAGDRPLVVFVDDADRAGPGLDRLLRDVAERSRNAPILLLTAGGADADADAALVRLEPLDDEAIGTIVASVLGDRALAPSLRDAIARQCGGVPLVAEQLVAKLVGDGHVRLDLGRWVAATQSDAFRAPASLDELLRARVRELGIDEQAVLGLAAVVGESFAWTTIAELVPAGSREAVRDQIASLVGSRLLRLASPADGAEAFAFAHPAIREAAVAEVPDDVRAEVHERYARWLEASGGAVHLRSPELMGSHVESAHRAIASVTGSGAEPLARRASALLGTAAGAASELGDARGAVDLWDRASSLLPPEDAGLAETLFEAGRARAALGNSGGADALLAHAGRIARTAGDPILEWRSKLVRATLRARSLDVDALEHVREVADATIEACLELGDDLGLAWAWSARGLVYRRRGHWAAAADAAERGAEHGRRAGRRPEEVVALRDLAGAIVDGRSPVSESIERCEGILERVRGERPAEQEVTAILAQLLARRGSFEEARELVAGAAAELEGLGMDREEAACLLASGRIEAMAGRLAEAEDALRRVADMADRVGDRVILSRVAASLAQVFLDLGRGEEALELTEATEPPSWDDVPTQVEWRAARARALSIAERHGEANALARQAVKLADQTDLVELRAHALLDLAEVLRLAGRPNEAAPFARRAIRALERKGARGEVGRARALLQRVDLRVATTTEPVSPADDEVPAKDETPIDDEAAAADEAPAGALTPVGQPEPAEGLARPATESEGPPERWMVEPSRPVEPGPEAPTHPEDPPKQDEATAKRSRWGWGR